MTDTGPFAKDRYCWGAWEQDSGPALLGQRMLTDPGSQRTAEEEPAPSPERPASTCTVRVTSEDDEGSPVVEKTVTVSFGPVPEAREARREWLGAFVDATASRLPDGVPGLVNTEKGMVVLPEECDVDGRPSSVTISAGRTGNERLGLAAAPARLGAEYDVATLLLAVANEGMKRRRCAPDEPFRVTSPVPETAEDPLDRLLGEEESCRLPGFGFAMSREAHYDGVPGVVENDLQLCTFTDTANLRAPRFAGQFVMAAQPRFAALLDGLPEQSDGHRLLRTTCAERPTVFFFQADDALRTAARPDPEGAFAAAVTAVTRRLGCPEAAPEP
ncbi:hypothetical protein [Streptomyces chumphonensis]|uniref:hypothetical protein n=1 Tax=Streptomyces chumphonensis TaxID=1214925 RepID=UPI003D746BE6